jgi:transcriptional regulator with XRE-family HTH domain
MDMIKVGKRMHDTRKEKDLTLQDVADSLGVAKSTIQRYEKGRFGNAKLPIIEAIARFLNVNPAWLIYKSEIKELVPETKKTAQGEITLSDFEYALFGEVRELDDEDKEELLRNARRFNELRKFRGERKK